MARGQLTPPNHISLDPERYLEPPLPSIVPQVPHIQGARWLKGERLVVCRVLVSRKPKPCGSLWTVRTSLLLGQSGFILAPVTSPGMSQL